MYQNNQVLKIKMCEYGAEFNYKSEDYETNYKIIVCIITYLVNGFTAIEAFNMFVNEDINEINLKNVIDFAIVNEIIKLLPNYQIRIDSYNEKHVDIVYNENIDIKKSGNQEKNIKNSFLINFYFLFLRF